MARSSSGPWFYAQKNAWYATCKGVKVNLKVKGEANEAEAVAAWHRHMAGLPVDAVPTPSPAMPKAVQSSPKPVPAVQGDTLPGLVAAFLADAKGRIKAESHRGYAKYLNPFAEAFKATKPDALTVATVERFSKGRGWSQSYRCGFVGTVVSLFKWAVETGRMDRSPVQGIRKPAKQSRGRKAVISPADHAKLVKHARGDFGLFLRLLWLTGCRPGEVAGLEARDIDMPNRCVVLAAHKTAEQTGRDRLIVLPNEAVGILAGLVARRPVGLLFPGEDGQRMDSNNIACRMSRLCIKAKVKATAYGYRHTMATDALASGVPDAQVAALLGHQGTAMLHKHYSHLTSRTAVLREALSSVRG